MKNFVGGTALLVACAMVGALLAVTGAKISGMQTALSLEPLIHLAIGSGFSAVTFLVLLLANRRAVVAAVGALIVAFLAGLVGHPVLEYHYDSNSKRFKDLEEASMQSYQNYYSKLREDPEIGLREKWYKARDKRRRAYEDSIWNQDVNYSTTTLSQLYSVDQMTVGLLKHPSFDKALLEREFHRALEQSLQGKPGCDKLVFILQNPNAKEEWFTEVASSGILDRDIFECSNSLRQLIEHHQKHKETEQVTPLNGP